MRKKFNKNRIYKQAAEQLCQLGFKATKPSFFELDLGDGLVGCIGIAGLNVVDGVLRVCPTASLYSRKHLKEIRDLLNSRRFNSGGCAVLPIGYLMRGRSYKEWYFNETETDVKEMKSMLAAIKKYAIPYLLEHIRKKTLLRAVKNAYEVYRDFNLPFVLLEMKEKTKAKRFVREQRKEYKKMPRQLCRTYEKFAKAFLEKY